MSTQALDKNVTTEVNGSLATEGNRHAAAYVHWIIHYHMLNRSRRIWYQDSVYYKIGSEIHSALKKELNIYIYKQASVKQFRYAIKVLNI